MATVLCVAIVLSTMGTAVFAEGDVVSNNVSTAEELAAALTKNEANIAVILEDNIDLPITSLGSITAGSGEYKLGGENTQEITINLNQKTLNVTTTYWSALGSVNPDATITVKNGTMVSTGNSATTWNANDLRFCNCNWVFEDVTFNKEVALDNAGKSTTMNNATINGTGDYYALWITAEGQNVTIDGLTINTPGRGIKIDEEYSNENVAKVTLNVSNATFTTAKKAAIMVKSAKGAEITTNIVDISGVAADTENIVWVDEDSKEYLELVTVNGEAAFVEGTVATVNGVGYTDVATAFVEADDGDEVVICAAGTYEVPEGKNITITGAVDSVVFDNIGAHNMGGASVTFNNVTFKYGNENYKGLQHAGDMAYNDCTINGQVFLYGNSETFNNCTFNQTSSDAYNVWTYGAKKVEFNECTFNSAGKSVLIYSEQTDLVNDVTVTKTAFNASAAVEGKAAIEMDSSLTAGINLAIDSETTATGFGTGNKSGNSLWNNKKGNDTEANNDITVTVNDETVLEPVTLPVKVATKDELVAAIANSTDGDRILLTADIDYGTDHLEIKNAITLDLGSKTLTTKARNYGLALRNDACVVTNGKLNHAGTVAAIKVWNAKEISKLEIDVTGTSASGNTIDGIVIQENAAGVDTIKNVTIHSTSGQGVSSGIKTYNCGNATEDVIGAMDDVDIDAKDVGMNIYAPCGTATDCNIKGGVSGIEIWIKGTYNASLDLVNSSVEGGQQAVYAHDEFSDKPVVNNGTITLTADNDSTFISDGVKLNKVINRITEAQITLPEAIVPVYVARVGYKSYESFVKAVEEANAVAEGATIELLKDVTLGETLEITGNVTISGEHTITRADNYTGTLFAVIAEATLTLDGGLVVDGGNAWNYINVPLEMDMANGAGTYVGNHITPAENGVNATASLIKNNGKLNANKVTIENSYSTNGVSAIDCGISSETILNGTVMQKIAANRSGAVVCVGGADAVLTIMGETRITGNFGIGNGGIIQNYGQGTTVNMEGGSIDNNHIGKSGTLYASYSGNANKINTFNMSGGIITKNIMEGYGPVYIHTNTVWNMTGGEISENTSFLPNYVRNNNPAGIMSGGKIVNNKITGTDYSNGYYVTHHDLRLNGKTGITGGEFTQDVTEYLAPDNGLVYNEATGTYVLTQELYEYNGVAYKTFSEVIEKIKSAPATLADEDKTPVVKVLATHRPSETIAIDTNIVMDLNGKSLLGVTGVNPIIRVLADVTITGNGMIDSANQGDGYCFIVGSSDGLVAGNLTIENGTFKGTTTAVSVTKGTATILDGDFRVKPYQVDGQDDNYNFLLNCIDANYKDGSAKIIVKGGKFTKFNPANNAAEGANTNFVAPGNMVVDNGDETWNVIGMVAMIGETGFATLTEAIKTAQANDTIKLIANIKENVTINKNLTIDGADKQYTGTMALNASNITVQNLNIVGGNIIKGNNTAASANITIKNCDFDGQMANVYAVELRATNKIVIEDCTAKDYGYGFLQVPKSNNTISVKNVDISGVNYGFKIDYSNGVTLENVTVTDARVAGILDSNYGTKTYTIMNCTITGESPVGVWDRKTGKIDTFIFAGTNDFGTKEFKIGEQATLKLAGTDAVLKACEGLTVTSTNEIYNVVYEDGAYKVQKVAKVGENHYYSLQEAIDAANDGDIITLVADIKTVQNVTINKNVVVDLNGHTVNGAILPSNGDITVKNGWIKNTDNGQSAIEINSGKLNLTNVNIESARHAIRIDGDVQAVIDGGTYKVVPVDGKTVHAVNVSGNANVVIKNGEFIGPKGTVADSGAAVNVQEGSTVTIEGGTFTRGKNNTLATKGTLAIYGGIYDQDPSAYVVDGYKTSDKANNFYVVYPEFKVSAIVNDADKTVKAGEEFEVYITVTGGDYTNAGWKLGYDPTKVEYIKAQGGVDAVDYAIVDSVLGEGQTSGNEYKNGEVYKKYTFSAKYPSTTVNSVFTIENVYVNNYEMAAWLDKTPAAMEGDTVTITNDLAFGGTIADKEVPYNGMYQKAEEFVANMTGAEITYSTEENGKYTTEVPAFKDAGEHTYYYKATLAGYTAVTGSAKLTITPATLAPNAEFNVDPDYDTVSVKAVLENLIDDSFKGTVTIEVDGEKVTFEASEFSYDGNGKAVAKQFKKIDLEEGKEYPVKVTYTANTAGDNYANAEGETKVNPDKKEITSDDLNKIKAALTNSYVYDGAKHYVKVDEANLPGEWKVEIPEIGLTDVGETMVTIKATDASGKYNEHTFNVVLKVTPIDITIVINNASKDLGQADPVFTSNINELLVAADHLGEVKYVREPGEAMGTYKINVTYTPNPNYNVVDIVEGNLYIGAPTDFKVEVVNNKLLKGDGYKQDYIAGYRLVLVYTNVDKAYFTYKGQEMYDVSDAPYEYYDYDFTTMTATKDDTDYKHIYAIVVEAEYGYEDTAENEAMYANNVEFASETAKSEKILYNSDINYTGELDVEDFSITNGVYNVLYRGKAFITRLLKADVNGNKLVDTEDARMIKEVVVK